MPLRPTTQSSNDLAMRPMARKLHELLGQLIVIDFRPGAISVNRLNEANNIAKSRKVVAAAKPTPQWAQRSKRKAEEI